MARTGRPKKIIPRDQFEKLCVLQCTEEEIASFFDCSVDTIERWCKKEYKATFADVFREKRQVGKISLRKSQWKLAEHNATMAIWLGKQYLGQKEQQEISISTTTDETIKEMEAYFDNQRRGIEAPLGEAD